MYNKKEKPDKIQGYTELEILEKIINLDKKYINLEPLRTFRLQVIKLLLDWVKIFDANTLFKEYPEEKRIEIPSEYLNSLFPSECSDVIFLPEFKVLIDDENVLYNASIYFKYVQDLETNFLAVYKSKIKYIDDFKIIATTMDELRDNFCYYLKYIFACDISSCDKELRGINRYSLALIYEAKAIKNDDDVKKTSRMKKYEKWLDLAIEDGNCDAYKRKIQDLHKGNLSKMTLSENLKASQFVLRLIAEVKEDFSAEQKIIYREIMYNTLILLYNQVDIFD